MHSRHDIFQNSHTFKQPEILEGSRHSALSYFMRFFAGDTFSVKNYLAAVGFVKAGYTVEDGGLTSSIGSDKTGDTVLINGKTEPIDDLKTCKAQHQIINC